MSQTITALSLKQRAIAALRQSEILSQAEAKEKAEVNRERTERKLRALLDKRLHITEGITFSFDEDNNAIATVEGLTFSASTDYENVRDFLQVHGQCRQCGEDGQQTIRDLPGLGRALEDFTPNFTHRCPQQQMAPTPEPETVETRLLSALREFVGGQNQ